MATTVKWADYPEDFNTKPDLLDLQAGHYCSHGTAGQPCGDKDKAHGL
jgi:hypothetical protein